MRVVLRADAGPARGTGHVMRCLTVAEAVVAQGHEAVLVGEIVDVPWLSGYVRASGLDHISCRRDELSIDLVKSAGGDRLVVDSYWIDPLAISTVDAVVPTLSIIDHDSRGIQTTWLLDQNLGAEQREWPRSRAAVLAGSRYALIRRAILDHRVDTGWELPSNPSVLVFMGGTDPSEIMTPIAQRFALDLPEVRIKFVTTASQVEAVSQACASMGQARVIGPTDELPNLLGTADVVVSAAGTSAWDILTMGKPVVLVGVVDNQSSGLNRVLERGMALGLDATREPVESVSELLSRLLSDEELRKTMIERAKTSFDGLGASRVAAALTHSE